MVLEALVSSQRVTQAHQEQAFGKERAQVPSGSCRPDTEVSRFKSPAPSCLTFKEENGSGPQAKPQPTVGFRKTPRSNTHEIPHHWWAEVEGVGQDFLDVFTVAKTL